MRSLLRNSKKNEKICEILVEETRVEISKMFDDVIKMNVKWIPKSIAQAVFKEIADEIFTKKMNNIGTDFFSGEISLLISEENPKVIAVQISRDIIEVFPKRIAGGIREQNALQVAWKILKIWPREIV